MRPLAVDSCFDHLQKTHGGREITHHVRTLEKPDRQDSSLIYQIVVLAFAQFAAEWIIKAGFNCVTNEVERFFLNIDNPAAHPAANFMLISFSFENCRTLSR